MSITSFFSGFFCKDEKRRLEDLGLELSNYRSNLLKKSAELEQLKAEYEQLDGNYKSCLSNLDNTQQDMQREIDRLTVECSNLKLMIDSHLRHIQELLDKQEPGLTLLSKTTKDLLQEYAERYARADIEYSGRFAGNKDNRYSMDVKAFCTQGMNDGKIIKRVNRGNCHVKDIMREKQLEFHKACDIAVMRVSNVFGCSYAFDSTTWNTPEFWMFASETEAMGRGDCEDMAIWRYVGCRIAGIPAEMLRVAAGTTFSLEGHATNFYFASDLKWHHINSTSNYGPSQDVKDLPVTKQSSDKLNLKDVWFSFNEDMTWYDLVTASQKKALNKKKMQKLSKYFKITPVFGVKR